MSRHDRKPAGAEIMGATGVIDLPQQTSYADKRGFADFDGDGVIDMVELGGFVSSFNKGNIFWGTRDVNNSVNFGFEEEPLLFTAPFKYRKIRSTEPKLDTGDINGDGCADFIHAGTEGKKRIMTYVLSALCD